MYTPGSILAANGMSLCDFPDFDSAMQTVKSLVKQSREAYGFEDKVVVSAEGPLCTRYMYRTPESITESKGTIIKESVVVAKQGAGELADCMMGG